MLQLFLRELLSVRQICCYAWLDGTICTETASLEKVKINMAVR